MTDLSPFALMAKHEFGIMDAIPVSGVRFDAYEPEQYNCIAIDDTYIEEIIGFLAGLECFWHSLDMPAKGLAYCGITLIPPGSAAEFADVIAQVPQLERLSQLLQKAQNEGKFIIHFGI